MTGEIIGTMCELTGFALLNYSIVKLLLKNCVNIYQPVLPVPLVKEDSLCTT